MSRLLFMAEGVTLAHVGRPLLLAQAMAARGHEVVFAAPDRYRRWLPPGIKWRSLQAQSPERFAAWLSSGRRLYSQGQLKGYIADDLNLIGTVRPDVVIGDFRLSLAASARTAGVPYVAISNAYWSPQNRLRPPPPALDGWKKLAFLVGWPLALRWHAGSIGEVLKPHGVDIGMSLQRAYTEADLTLYADHPDLYPQVQASGREAFLGPMAWTPDIPLPDWWGQVPADRPVAYLSLGSSGAATAAPLIARALLSEGFTVIAATAGHESLAAEENRIFVVDYLPGAAACARADLVVCNGGSPGANQALAAGRPVLGVCSNLDQFLNMQAVQAHGAGLTARSDGLSLAGLRRSIGRLHDPRFPAAAKRLSNCTLDPGEVLAEAVSRLAGGPTGRVRR